MADPTPLRSVRPRPLAAVTKYPFAPAFERAMVYRACRDPRVWESVGRHVLPDRMNDERAATIMKAVGRVVRRTGAGPSSPTAVIQDLVDRHREGKEGPDVARVADDLLIQVEDNDPGLPTIEEVIAMASEVLQREAKNDLLRELSLAVGKNADISRFAASIEDIDSIGKAGTTQTLGLGDAWSAIASLDRTNRISTGLKSLDDIVEGLPPSYLLCWGAAAGVGKTTAMIQQFCSAWIHGRNVAYLPTEESSAVVLMKVAAFLTCSRIKDVGALDPVVKAKLDAVVADGKLAVRDLQEGSTVSQLRRVVDDVARGMPGGKLDAVFVDYDKLSGRASDRNSYEEYKTIYRGLSTLSRDLKGWVVVGSQLKEFDAKKEEPGQDKLADSRWKGRICDGVFVMWPDPEGDPQDRMIRVAKNRGEGAGRTAGPVPCELEYGRLGPLPGGS